MRIGSDSDIVSGMRATGKLHLGHYYGVLANWLKLQAEYKCYFFIADWHALTTHYAQPADLANNSKNLLIDWLAVGIDPEQAVIFRQSDVPEIAELVLLLGMITPLGWLERVPTYKDQLRELSHHEINTYGFLGYALLMSADILLYKPKLVPVGEDQIAHVEFCREIARRFNYLYGNVLIEPQALLTEHPKMVGLDGRKMSKSYDNTIGLREDPETTTHKVKTMPTDPARVKRTDAGDPEKCPVWQWHKVYSDADTRAWIVEGCTSAKIGCLDCKQSVLKRVLAQQQEFRERASIWENNPSKLNKITQDGAQVAREAARSTLNQVKQVMGLKTCN